jgi:hypothetical protein
MKLDTSRLHVWALQPAAIASLQISIFQLASAGLLPVSIAIHWGITMQPDRFVSINEFALTALVIQLLFWIPSVSISVFAKTKVRIKKLLLLILGVVFWQISVIITTSALIQVGSSDGAPISFPLPLFIFFIICVPLLLFYLLAMPEVVVADQVEVKLRGITVMAFQPGEIVSAAVGTISAKEFGGWGIRLTTRKIGFVSSKGPAVRLNLDDGTEVSIRSQDPQSIVRQIKNLIS